MSGNPGRHHMHERRGRPERSAVVRASTGPTTHRPAQGCEGAARDADGWCALRRPAFDIEYHRNPRRSDRCGAADGPGTRREDGVEPRSPGGEGQPWQPMKATRPPSCTATASRTLRRRRRGLHPMADRAGRSRAPGIAVRRDNHAPARPPALHPQDGKSAAGRQRLSARLEVALRVPRASCSVCVRFVYEASFPLPAGKAGDAAGPMPRRRT